MPTPFSFDGNLRIPADHGLQPEPVPFAFSSQFTARAEFVYPLSGSGTQTVNLGAIQPPGVKGLFIKVDPSAYAAPVLVRINEETVGTEISAGGFLALGSPSPSTGVTALDITYTTAVTVRVWAFG